MIELCYNRKNEYDFFEVDEMELAKVLEDRCIKDVLFDNLRSYLFNFGYIKIIYGDLEGYFVFANQEEDSPTHFCYNLDYLNGWLYGAVQANNNRIKGLTVK